MVTYRVTIKLKDMAFAKAFLEWMLNIHIPNVLKTGGPRMFSGRINAKGTMDGKPLDTFEVDYYFDSRDALLSYRSEFGPALADEYKEAGWEEKTIVERNILTPWEDLGLNIELLEPQQAAV